MPKYYNGHNYKAILNRNLYCTNNLQQWEELTIIISKVSEVVDMEPLSELVSFTGNDPIRSVLLEFFDHEES